MSANSKSAAEEEENPDEDENGRRNPYAPRGTPKRRRYPCSCSFCRENFISLFHPFEPGCSPSRPRDDEVDDEGGEDSCGRRENARSVRSKKSLWTQEEESSPLAGKEEKPKKIFASPLALGVQEEEDLAAPLKNLQLTPDKKLHRDEINGRVFSPGQGLECLKKLHRGSSRVSEDCGWLDLSLSSPREDSGGAGDSVAAMRLDMEDVEAEGGAHVEDDRESRSEKLRFRSWLESDRLDLNLLPPEEDSGGAGSGLASMRSDKETVEVVGDDAERKLEKPYLHSSSEIGRLDFKLLLPEGDSGGARNGAAATGLCMDNDEVDGAPAQDSRIMENIEGDGERRLEKLHLHPWADSERLSLKLLLPQDGGGGGNGAAAMRSDMENVEVEGATSGIPRIVDKLQDDGESRLEQPCLHSWLEPERLDLSLSLPEEDNGGAGNGAAAVRLDVEDVKADGGESRLEEPCFHFWPESAGLDLNLPPEEEDCGGAGRSMEAMRVDMENVDIIQKLCWCDSYMK